MTIKIISPPEMRPVSLDQIKQHLRITHDVEDEKLLELADAAVSYVESESHKALIYQTLLQKDLKLNSKQQLNLVISPVETSVKVEAVSLTGEQFTIPPSDYRLSGSPQGTIIQVIGWGRLDQACNSFNVEYVAVYGGAPDNVPANLRQALLM